MDVEVVGGAVGGDRHAVAGQQRVVVDNRARPAAVKLTRWLSSAGLASGRPRSRASRALRAARGDGLAARLTASPCSARTVYRPALGRGRPGSRAAASGSREIGGLHDERPAVGQPQAAQPEDLAGPAEAGADVVRRGATVSAASSRVVISRALGGEVGGEAAQVAEVVGVPGGHVGAAAVPGVDEPVVGEQLEGLPQGHDADAELAGQLALGGQRSCPAATGRW